MKMHRLTRQLSRIILLSVSLVLGSSGLAQNAAEAILGEWYSPEKDGKFLFYKANGKYYGKLVWTKVPYDENGKPVTDKKNPDPAKRSHPLIGMNIFTDFVYDSEANEWIAGKVYDTRYGDTYCCKMKMISNLVLEVRGYILLPCLGQSAYFTRNK